MQWRLAHVFALAGIPATVVGTAIGRHLPQSAVLIGFAVVMGVAGVRMLRDQDDIGTACTVGGLWHQLAAVRHALHTRRMLVGLLTGLFGVAHTGDAAINGLTLIDVRQTSEYGDSHIPGALNIPLHELAERIAEVPANEVWVHCGSGYRASIAASILDRSHHDVVLIDDIFDNAKSNDLASDTWTRTGICGQLLDASRQPSHLCA